MLGRWMIAGLAFAALATMGQPTAQASPLCTGALSSIIAGGPCTDASGLYTLTFTATTGTNRSTSDSHIDVSVTLTGNVLDVQFLPDAGAGFALSSPNNTTGHYNFHYTVAFPANMGMTNAQIDIINPFVSAGNGSVDGFKELNNTYEIDTPTNFGGAGNYVTLSSSTALPDLKTPVTVEDDISIHSSSSTVTARVGNGAAHPGAVDNLLTIVTVPEPVSSALCGLGLLALGFTRKKFRK